MATGSNSNRGESRIRQNYTPELEALINQQINMEFYADYVYMAMATHFQRDDVALHGFAKFFKVCLCFLLDHISLKG
jgi:ferritin heavy chain